MPATAKTKTKQTASAIELISGQVTTVPLNLIDRDEGQPRESFDDAFLEELATGIKNDGVQQPVILRVHPKQPERFMIVDGENRVRASRLAKKKTIIAIPYTGKKTGKDADLVRLLNQVKVNHQRRDLNAMDWAHLFYTLNKGHKLTQPQIEQTLKDHGVGNYGRSYISNILMLRKLPQWIQDLIRSDEITAAHGKYLLPAMVSEKVTEAIKTKFLRDEDPWRPGVRKLQQEIYFTFGREHMELTGWKTNFDYKEKCVQTHCKKYRKITTEYSEGTFCLDTQCYAKFQAEAHKQAEKDKETANNQDCDTDGVPELKLDDKKRVDLDQLDMFVEFQSLDAGRFDKTECEKCPDRHVAFDKEEYDDSVEHAAEGETYNEKDFETESCFNTICFEKKQEAADKARNAANTLAANAIAQKLKDAPALALRLLVWLASNGPDGVTNNDNEQERLVFNYPRLSRNDDELSKALFQRQLLSLPQFLAANEIAFIPLAESTAHHLDSHNLKQLINYFKIEITDFQVDEIYICSLNKSQMINMVEVLKETDLPVGVYNDFNVDLKKDLNETQLCDLMLKHQQYFKAPAKEIQQAWQKIMSEGE